MQSRSSFPCVERAISWVIDSFIWTEAKANEQQQIFNISRRMFVKVSGCTTVCLLATRKKWEKWSLRTISPIAVLNSCRSFWFNHFVYKRWKMKGILTANKRFKVWSPNLAINRLKGICITDQSSKTVDFLDCVHFDFCLSCVFKIIKQNLFQFIQDDNC